MSGFIQITTTVGAREEAEQIANALVERRLAACVQVIGPIKSVYRWQGNVEHADEWLCVIKTTENKFEAAAAAIRQLHPYDCPEVIAVPIVAGSDAYLAWLREQTDE